MNILNHNIISFANWARLIGTEFDEINRNRLTKGQRMRRTFILSAIVIALIFSAEASGQFYNGHQMNFGKNRVQYFDYYWSFYRFDDFDCYFNEYGRELANYTADFATEKLEEIEDFFDYTLEKRLIFVIYNKQAEYKQSNIGLVTSDEETYNTGGFSRIIKNKVMLYFEGDHESYNNQVAASITEVLVNEILYNADVRDRVSSSSVINMPDWYLKGLVRYVSEGWSYEAENRAKDGIMTGRYRKISHLENEDAVNAGHSFWRFIGDQYGDALIPNIIYITKVYKNIEDGFLYVTGRKLKDLLIEWTNYYRGVYAGDKNLPGNDANVFRTSKKDQIFQQVKVSPDGQYIAYVTNDLGRKRIWLYESATGKNKIIFRAEPKIHIESDRTYPVLAWHPSGKILTYINEEKAANVIYFYRINDKTTEERNILYFDKILDFSYAPEGSRLVFSAVKDGITDIYIHTITSGTNEQITRDIADDLNPSFLRNSPDEILFSSNRMSDTLTNKADPFEKLGMTYDLFTYNISKKGNTLTRLSEGNYTDRLLSAETTRKNFAYVGNTSGVLNRYTASFDSTISYIDTTTHYRYYISSKAITNYDRNILDNSIANGSDTYGEILYSKNKYLLRKGQLSQSKPVPDNEIVTTAFRMKDMKLMHKADSIEQLRQWLIQEDRKRRDTLTKPLYEYYITNEPIDISHYIFEKEKQNYYEQLWKKDYMDIDLDTGVLDFPAIRIYETSFYNNYLVTQMDFSFLNNTYQIYNSGAPYYNPGINGLIRFGIIDLFESYRVTGGLRLSANFDSNEYLVSVENLKGKFDKQLIFHRLAFLGYSGDTLYKTHTHNLYLSYARPFSQALTLKGTLSYRYDRTVPLSTEMATLSAGNISRHWASLKGEVIYDNTRKRSINIYYGTRFKIFGEYYRELTSKKSDMFVVGADFRTYTRIHRELIWANRFAASSSWGPTRLVYYLGGVDNWMGYFFRKYTMFDNTIPVNPNVNYGFQALATNMRGFSQNVRNGNNFALINSEIRWPVVRYLAGHPLKSNFLNSIQVVGFGDIGTAWTGSSPWSGDNAYDNQTFENGPVKVTLDSNRDPIVAGFGAGARVQLLGYFVRADWAWGIENNYILPKMFYLSFSLDF